MEPLLGPVAVIERGPGRFSITGELDLATAHHLDTLETVHGPLVLDLHGVTFIDSTGIRALLRLWQRCPHPHCTFQIESCSLPTERVLQIAGLYELLTESREAQESNGEAAT
jgi:anti-anti-sigma factor